MSKLSDEFGLVVQSFCESVDSPRALAVWLCYKYDQRALVELPPPLQTPDVNRFALDYAATELLSKARFLRTGVDLDNVALTKWKSCESKNRATNQDLREARLRPIDGRVQTLIFKASRKIANLLGPLDVTQVLGGCKWGPGASLDVSRREADPGTKMSKLPISVTRDAAPYLARRISGDPHWFMALTGLMPEGPFSIVPRACFEYARGNAMVLVEKNAKTKRVISKEPTGNSFLQFGPHEYIRERLRRRGIRLDDQSINQRAAAMAYAKGWATLDLSAASDTISRELVYDLLPLEWALFLDRLRSPETRLPDGTWVRLEKFASMGNAFTFELETLIFWAICSSVETFQEGDELCVYGDDIVIEGTAAAEAVWALHAVGFTVNSEKSHLSGPFHESCGEHYYYGVNVTPAYQKEAPRGAPHEVIRLHNRIVRLRNRLLAEGLTPPTFKPALRRITQWYPPKWPFPRIPEGCDEDGGFLRSSTEIPFCPSNGYRCVVLDYVPSKRRTHDAGLLAYKIRRPQFRTAYGTSEWPDVGRWRTRVRYLPVHAVKH